MPTLPEMSKILSSSNLAYGVYSKQFERDLQDYFSTDYVLVVNSFETAISVVITTLGISFGDEVLLSPLACLASTQPYATHGLKLKWCDVDPTTGTLSPSSLKERISNRTKLIVHNHFCGIPGKINEINDIAKSLGIPVIDDGIECFGSRYKGNLIGNCGTDITVFSFTAVRNPNTIDGGCIIFRDRELFEKAMLIRDCGIDRQRFRLPNGEINPQCDINVYGYSGTMSNVNGYIGCRQMESINAILKKQRDNSRFWDDYFKDKKDVHIISPEYGQPNYWIYGLLADNKASFMNEMEEINITASSVHAKNNIYSIFGNSEELVGVNDFYNKFVALPCGWWFNGI